VPIDFELVAIGFEDCDGEGQWFLDTETGEAVRLSGDDDDELREQIEELASATEISRIKVRMPVIATWPSSSTR
jgi:hypothetical protein